MTTLRPIMPRASITWSLLIVAVGWLVPGGSALSQQTKPITPPTAKEKARKAEKAEKKETAAPVDLNSATTEELMTLPGIGEAFARKIVDARPHKSVEDLSGLGVSSRVLGEIKPLAVVHPLPVAVDLNHDPLNRLETLPGVGPTLAKEVIAGRPYAGFDDLAKVKGFGPAKVDSLKGRVKFGKAEPAARPKHEVKEEPVKAEPRAEPRASVSKTSREAGQPGSKVNLNTASLEELDALPGIGMVRAQAIVAARPFAKIEDIMKIKGIKEVEFGKVKDMITVGR